MRNLHVSVVATQYSYPFSPYDYPSYSTANQSQQMWLPPRHASPCRPSQLQDESNPWILKFVCGNIRVCQSCRDSLSATSSRPYDLCVSHLGKRQYWNSTSGSWCVPSRATNCARVAGIKFANSAFVPSTLVVPDDIHPRLSDVHKCYS